MDLYLTAITREAAGLLLGLAWAVVAAGVLLAVSTCFALAASTTMLLVGRRRGRIRPPARPWAGAVLNRCRTLAR